MRKHLPLVSLATLTLAGALCSAPPALAQVAGATTTVEATITESVHLARGWSVRKTLMGKTIYNDAGQRVGKIQDLIISPERNVSYVIVKAGGFAGIGRHDVAVPVTQIQDLSGKLVMANATRDTIKAMPHFAYAIDTATRDRFVAAADKDIAAGKAKVSELERKAGVAANEAKARIDVQIAALQVDVKSAETRLTLMKEATAARWRDFEASVSEATARLRKAVDTAAG